MLPDKQTQRRIWQRVYATPATYHVPRQALVQCHRRCRENLRVFMHHSSDAIYGPAYQRLAELTQLQIAMLESIEKQRG